MSVSAKGNPYQVSSTLSLGSSLSVFCWQDRNTTSFLFPFVNIVILLPNKVAVLVMKKQTFSGWKILFNTYEKWKILTENVEVGCLIHLKCIFKELLMAVCLK